MDSNNSLTEVGAQSTVFKANRDSSDSHPAEWKVSQVNRFERLPVTVATHIL